MSQFKTLQFLSDYLITPDAIVGLANRYNLEVPSKPTIIKWFSRKSIPGEWWPVVIALLELHRGAPVSLANYIEGENQNADDIFA